MGDGKVVQDVTLERCRSSEGRTMSVLEKGTKKKEKERHEKQEGPGRLGNQTRGPDEKTRHCRLAR
jgi:hypothetical protein